MRKIAPPGRVGVLVKFKVSFRVGRQPDNWPGEKSGLGFGFGGGQFSLEAIVLEPFFTS